MKRAIFLICFIFLLVQFAYAIPPTPPPKFLGAFTIGTLPAASDGDAAVVTDGSTATDCTVGSGSTLNLCLYDEGAGTWVVAGDGTGGAGSGSVTTIEENDAQVGGSDIVYLDFGYGFSIAESPDTEINIDLDVTPSSGNATLIVEQDALQVKYDTTDFTEGTTGLLLDASPTISTSLAIGSDPADTGALRLDNGAGIYWEDATEGYLLHVDDTSLRTNLAFDITGSGGLILSSDGTITQSADNYFTLTENSDTLQAYFGGTDIDLIWRDGVLNIRNAEDSVNAIVEIEGKDAGERGELRVLSDGDDKYIQLYHDDTDAVIAASAGGVNITPATGSDILLDGTISIDAGVVTGATSITSTSFVGALTGNSDTVTVADAANDTTTWPLLGTSATGSLAPATDSSLSYNANTGVLTATRFTDGTASMTGGAISGLTTPLTVEQGGTEAATFTDGGVLLGSGTGAITAMSVLNDGEMIVGDGTTDPVAESGATLRTSIGVGTGDSPQFTGIELSHATDNTLTASGGVLSIEGAALGKVAGQAWTGTHNFGGATALEIPNGTSDPASTTGSVALDTDGDGGDYDGPTLTVSTNGATMGYALLLSALPSDDNYILKYDAATDTVGWEADASAGTTALDDISDPDAATSISLDDTETVVITSAQDTAGSVWTIQDTDNDVANQVYLLDLDYSADDGQANADFILAQDSGGEVWRLGQDGDVTTTDGDYTTTNGTITAEHLSSTDDIEVTDDILLADGAVVGITGNEIITFNAAGSINVTGATMDVDGDFTAATITSDAGLGGTTLALSDDLTMTSASPDILFVDSTNSGEAKIVISDNADPDGIMDLQVDEAGTLASYIQLDGANSTVDILKALTTASTSDLSAGAVTVGTLSGTIDAGGATSFEIPNKDADPSATGQIIVDTSVTNYTNGALRFYDGTNIRHALSMVAATAEGCTDDQVAAYDADADVWYCKDDVGAATALDDVGDPDAASSISLDDTETVTFTSAQDTAGSVFTIQDSDNDVANQVYLLDLDYSADDGQANADYIIAQDSGGTVWVLGQDGDVVTTDGDYTTTNGTISAEQLTSTDDVDIADALNIGSATVDSGPITMIQGAQTGDPQVILDLTADANGDFSVTTDTGDILAVSAADITLQVQDESITLADGGANLINVSSATSVATVDFQTINLATDALDLSEGNITNAGQIDADLIDADGAALALGDGDETVAINSSDWDIDATGAISNTQFDADNNTITNVPNSGIKWSDIDNLADEGLLVIADESTDTTSFPLFVTAATGNLAAKTGTNLTFNSATGELGATIGAFPTLNVTTLLNVDEDVDIDFDNADEEMVITNSAEYGANGSQVSIINSDADVGAQMYLLNLDYSADDGQANADFIIAQDSGGTVWTLGQNGDQSSTSGTLTYGTITDGTFTATSGNFSGVGTLTATGLIQSSASAPAIGTSDSDDAAGTGSLTFASANTQDVIGSIYVDVAGVATEYMQIDGVAETVDMLKPLTGTDATFTGTTTVTTLEQSAVATPTWLAQDSSTSADGTFDIKVDATTADYAGLLRLYVDEGDGAGADGAEDVLFMWLNGSGANSTASGTIEFERIGNFEMGVSTSNGTTGAGFVNFYEDEDNGSNYVAVAAPATLTGNITFTLPSSNGTDGYVLKTDGSGNTSWTTAGAATAWDDLNDPDNNGTTTITFDSVAENTVLSTAYDSAGSFFNIDNTDADIANQVYLLDLEYSVDDGQALADYLIARDAGGTVWILGQDGDVTTTDGDYTTTNGTISAEQLTSTDDVDITDALNIGSATADSGPITMIQGAQTGDPQVVLDLTADANGDFSVTTDTGDILIVSAADITLTGTNLFVSDGVVIGTASDADAMTLAANGELTLTQELQAGAGIDATGGAVLIPAGANPATSAAGSISVDSDDHFIEFYSDASKVVGAVIAESFSIVEPDTIVGIEPNVLLKQFVAEAYPHGVTIVSIHVGTDGTDVTDDSINFERWTGEDDGSPDTIETIDMTGVDNNEDDSLTNHPAADDYLVADITGWDDDIPMIIITVAYTINPGD